MSVGVLPRQASGSGRPMEVMAKGGSGDVVRAMFSYESASKRFVCTIERSCRRAVGVLVGMRWG